MTTPAADTGPARDRPLGGRHAATAPAARIETRFADTADGSSSLLLRVYPDTISVSSFEPELTQDEIDAGHGLLGPGLAGGQPAARPGRRAGTLARARRQLHPAAGGLDRAAAHAK